MTLTDHARETPSLPWIRNKEEGLTVMIVPVTQIGWCRLWIVWEEDGFEVFERVKKSLASSQSPSMIGEDSTVMDWARQWQRGEEEKPTGECYGRLGNAHWRREYPFLSSGWIWMIIVEEKLGGEASPSFSVLPSSLCERAKMCYSNYCSFLKIYLRSKWTSEIALDLNKGIRWNLNGWSRWPDLSGWTGWTRSK